MDVRIIGALLAILLPCAIPTCSGPDVNQIIAKSVQAIKHDWEEAPKYDCFERDRLQHGTKSYKDLMIDGSPYEMLVEVNGKPLSAGQEAAEKRKLQETIAKRKAESPQERGQRIQKYEQENKRDHELIDQLTQAFDFHLEGEQKLNGFDVYVLRATRRRAYKPTSTQTQVLTGMDGTLWIDKKTYQWVKVEAHVIHPVNIYGFVAQVEPGTRFELEKMPVAAGVWLQEHFSMAAHVNVIYLFKKHQFDDITYYGCSFQTEKF
jgi:hypothetical protein